MIAFLAIFSERGGAAKKAGRNNRKGVLQPRPTGNPRNQGLDIAREMVYDNYTVLRFRFGNEKAIRKERKP